MAEPILAIKDLRVGFPTRRGTRVAVDGEVSNSTFAETFALWRSLTMPVRTIARTAFRGVFSRWSARIVYSCVRRMASR